MRGMKLAAASRLLIYGQLRPAERCFAVGAGERNLPPMPKRGSDATGRRFFDEFGSVRVSRFHATGVIDPAKRQASIPVPRGTTKLIGTAHVRFPNGGGYSYFPLPKLRQARRSPVPH